MGTSAPRVAVVTGGTVGIGLATARALLDRGYRVAIFGHQAQNTEKAAQALTDEYGAGKIIARTVDLGEATEVEGFFNNLANEWEPPEIIVCNAGISPKSQGGPTPFASLGLDEWNTVLSVNLTGAMLCCQAVVPGMAMKRYGRIVLVGSNAGRTLPKIAGTAYVTSKSALAGFTRSLVGSYAGCGITINLVAPGRIATSMIGDPESPTNRAALNRIPAGRLGKPNDVAAVITFLISDEAGFVNGAIIDVNGGEFVPA